MSLFAASAILLSIQSSSSIDLIDTVAPGQPTPHPRTQQIDGYVKGWMERRNISGVSVGVLRRGKVQHIGHYGKADLEQKKPVHAKTTFEIASLTKQFTAFAIQLLAQEGKLTLDDPVTKHVTLPPQFGKIKIRHLLTHTSGMTDYMSSPEFEQWMKRSPTKEEVRTWIAASPMRFAPGERWEYCNSGYFLAGLVIESCSKKDYIEFLNERIFKPLGMRNTKACGNHGEPNLAQGLEWQNGKYQASPLIPYSLMYATGGLVSTVEDMLKWQVALDSDKLLAKKYRAELWKEIQLSSGKAPDTVTRFIEQDRFGYGLGWFVKPDARGSRPEWVWSYGSSWGFSSYIVKVPKQDLTVVVLTNRESGYDVSPFFTPFLLAEGVARICAPNSLRPNTPVVSRAAPNKESLDALKQCIDLVRAGQRPERLFSDSFKQVYSPRVAAEYTRFLTVVGSPKKISLLHEKEENGIRESSYKVSFADTSWVLDLTMCQGQVFNFEILREVD